MFTQRTSIGLDVHARSVLAAVIDTGTGEVIERRLGTSNEAVVGFVNEVAAGHGDVLVTYEAGPTGFGLARAVTGAGHACQVAAPSKLLRPAGDRVKTDARDAMLLARLARNDEITPVTIPSIAAESARDLVRARDDVRQELMATRHRLSKLLLRHGHVYDGGKAWTSAHDAWMRQVRREALAVHGAGTVAAFDDAYDAVCHTLARRDRLDAQITALASDPAGPAAEFVDITTRLCCLRGISTLTGFALTVEIGDWHRLSGASIGAYLGLVPSEHSSGGSRRQGAITKTGNSHARRLLVEAAWHHKPRYTPGKTLQDRWAKAPAAVVERADAGNRRLHHRWQVMTAHKKKHTIATTAIAREMAGWCWSLATLDVMDC